MHAYAFPEDEHAIGTMLVADFSRFSSYRLDPAALIAVLWGWERAISAAGLYEDGFSLHDIWANAFDHIKSFGIDTVDAVQRKQTEELGKEVEKLLQKYTTVKEEGADAEAEQE
uniref:Uncharacterized protein n=1 Tax=Chrysotila carterae TaxID=13221 RepID=A0A7S4ETV0_CHRCT|eukprot:2317521-Pleurochrysis_carterae.AAC.6